MTKSDILQWFSTNSEALQTDRILLILEFSIVVGMVIFLTYRLAYQGVAYNARFNVGNIVLVLIAATIMLMISSNIAISLGMVGALSIIRFRTAIKDPQDTIYLFWSVVEGLCVGAQIYKLALLSSLVIAAVLLCGSFYGAFQKKYLIIIRGGSFSPDEVAAVIAKHHRKNKMRAANREEAHTEVICEVSSRRPVSTSLVEELERIEQVTGVDWLLETEGYVG